MTDASTNGKDTVTGTLDDDVLVGGNGSDSLFGGAGDDDLSGGNGSDLLQGGAGDDTLNGGNGKDTAIYSGVVADYVLFRLSDGTIRVLDLREALDGTDLVSGIEFFRFADMTLSASALPFSAVTTSNSTGGVDTTLAAPSALTPELGTVGVDTVFYAGSDSIVLPDTIENVTLSGSASTEVVANDLSNVLIGNSGDNVLYAKGGHDAVFGGIGDDTLVAGSGEGNDHYDGGDGVDTITFLSTSSGVFVDLAAGTATGPEIGFDTLTDIENVTGGSGDDTLLGSVVSNVLIGGDGFDTLAGDAGNDVLTGGSGLDTFSGTLAELDGDTITDFTASDRIVVEGSVLDSARISISEDGGDTLLHFLDGSGNVDSTLRLTGILGGTLELATDGPNTVLTLDVSPPGGDPGVYLEADDPNAIDGRAGWYHYGNSSDQVFVSHDDEADFYIFDLNVSDEWRGDVQGSDSVDVFQYYQDVLYMSDDQSSQYAVDLSEPVIVGDGITSSFQSHDLSDPDDLVVLGSFTADIFVGLL